MTKSYFLQLVGNPSAKGFRGTPKGNGIKEGFVGWQRSRDNKKTSDSLRCVYAGSFCDAPEARAIFAYESGELRSSLITL